MKKVTITFDVSPSDSNKEIEKRVEDLLENSDLFEYLNYPNWDIKFKD